jgi:hypothetical protein
LLQPALPQATLHQPFQPSKAPVLRHQSLEGGSCHCAAHAACLPTHHRSEGRAARQLPRHTPCIECSMAAVLEAAVLSALTAKPIQSVLGTAAHQRF